MWRTIGHDKAVNNLTNGLLDGRLSHAYLITGSPQIGKMTLALDIARMVNCTGDEPPCSECSQCQRIDDSLHADLRIVSLTAREEGQPQRTAISIDQIREVQKEASLKPFEGEYRVIIVDGVELMTAEASNSLLKTLEEPPDQVIMLLLAPDILAVLETIVSRCQRIDLKPVPIRTISQTLQDQYIVDTERATELARLSRGRIGWAVGAAKDAAITERMSGDVDTLERLIADGLEPRFSVANDMATRFTRNREAVQATLDLWIEWWRDVLAVNKDVSQYAANLSRMESIKAVAEAISPREIVTAIKATQETKTRLQRNVNARLALEQLMLSLPRVEGLAELVREKEQV